MSGIYGCILRNTGNIALTQQGLHFWIDEYGCNQIEKETEYYLLGVNLEHFSARIPEQKEVLENNGKIAVIDSVIFNRDELSETYHIDIWNLSDEELLFKLISLYGYKVLDNVNGEFAGAIYDECTGDLVLFRDHLGLRPIYYYVDDELVLFSTDIRGILASDRVNISIDENKIYITAVGLFYNSEENTEYNEIKYLRMASYAVIHTKGEKSGSIDKHIYWHPGQTKIRYRTDKDYQNQLRYLVEDAMKIRLNTTDDPVGAELSGGLDSTVISCLLNQSGYKGYYFSWSRSPEEVPLNEEGDERILIEEICQREGITCEYRKRNYPEEAALAGTIRSDILPGYTNTTTVSTASAWFKSKGVRVVLTGHGGDEGISHRSSPYELWHHKEYYSYVKELYGTTEGSSLRVLRTIKRLYRNIIKDNPRAWDLSIQVDSIEEFLNQEFQNRMSSDYQAPEYTYFYDPLKYIELGTMRHRMDNTVFQTVRYGVRYMYPYLDYRLIDFAVSIPRNQFWRNGKDRWIYRETFKELLPASLDKMYSKRTLSSSNQNEVTPDIMKQYQGYMDYTVKSLERTYWSSYLDFNKLDHFKVKDNVTQQELGIIYFQSCRLAILDMIHKAMVRSSEPIKNMKENN